MHRLGDRLDRRDALPADTPCEAALTLFLRDPDCRALAVVAGDRPIGLLAREPFLARMEVRGAGARPVRDVLEPDALAADADEPVEAFLARVLPERPAALLNGFIIVRDGAYAGVCDLARLAGAGRAATPRDKGGKAGRAAAARAPESQSSGPALIERLRAQAREPIEHARAAAEALARMRLPHGAAAHVEVIAEAAKSTLALLDVTVDLQRAEAGRLELQPAAQRLQELMDAIETNWRARVETAGVTLFVSYDGQPDFAAMVDPARLTQVFDALIGHAMVHAGRGVIEASLQVRPAGDGYELIGRVRDNAQAYAPDYLDTIFTGSGGGLGAADAGLQLELMLASRAMEAMDGRLEAKANPGPGATLSFRMTAAEAEAAGGPADAGPTGGDSARAAHILVVDDNATNRMVVEALCEMFDCSTESVVDGVEAVEAAKAGRFDVILMDIKMPRMDGVTAAREIRKLPAPAGRVPIIALTANADADEVAQYLAAGMRMVVEKPIKPERLMEALDAALAEDDSKAAAA
jgi:CheY-like chemotaxis protein/signal transduction histidine kinase